MDHTDRSHAGSSDEDTRARTHLANERTFLAWFRTAMTLIALGIAAAQFLALHATPGHPIVSSMSSILVVAGVVMALGAARRYYTSRSRIDAAAFRPASMSVLLTTVAATVTGGLALLFIWLVRGGSGS